MFKTNIFWSVWLAFGAALLALSTFLVGNGSALAETEPAQVEATIYLFGRDDCGFCKEAFAFLKSENLPYTYLNINEDKAANTLFDQVAEKHELTRVTPIMVIGERVLVGFDSPETTGVEMRKALKEAESSSIKTVEDHLQFAPKQDVLTSGGCSGTSCSLGEGSFTFNLPYFGVVDLRSFSLFSLSFVLGVVDGFNPCAMWVLVTFLILLSQAGSKKKMVLLAGIFISAQGIMYNLILNVWYKTWDFVALDQIVTPVVGLIAVGGSLFFLWRWYKNREAQLICDISDLETQGKTIQKFKKIVEQPVTIISILSILAIAFSVNIIEFACSIGIPQAYTKILELNFLTYLERQWYILIFSLGYMLDDVIVFAMAIWGYSRLEAHGGKYAQWSLLFGGILMFILGFVLILNPELLVI